MILEYGYYVRGKTNFWFKRKNVLYFLRGWDAKPKVVKRFRFQNHFEGLNYDSECVGSFTSRFNRKPYHHPQSFNTTKAFSTLTLQKL